MFDDAILKAFRVVRMRKAKIEHDFRDEIHGSLQILNKVAYDEDIDNMYRCFLHANSDDFGAYPPLEGNFGLKLENNWLGDILTCLKDVLHSTDGRHVADELWKMTSRCLTFEEKNEKTSWMDIEMLNRIFKALGSELIDFEHLYTTGSLLFVDFVVRDSDLTRVTVGRSEMMSMLGDYSQGFYEPKAIKNAIVNLPGFTKSLASQIRQAHPTAAMKEQDDAILAQVKESLNNKEEIIQNILRGLDCSK